MAGDLEDFLRRAAAKRAATLRAVREEASRAERPHRAQSERVIEAERIEDDEGIEVLAESITLSPGTPASVVGRTPTPRPAPRPAAAVPTPAVTRETAPTASNAQTRGAVADDLIQSLRKPGGLRDAMLIREVFDRPLHRW